MTFAQDVSLGAKSQKSVSNLSLLYLVAKETGHVILAIFGMFGYENMHKLLFYFVEQDWNKSPDIFFVIWLWPQDVNV